MSDAYTPAELKQLRKQIAEYDNDLRRKGMLADGVTDDAFRTERCWLATLDEAPAQSIDARGLAIRIINLLARIPERWEDPLIERIEQLIVEAQKWEK